MKKRNGFMLDGTSFYLELRSSNSNLLILAMVPPATGRPILFIRKWVIVTLQIALLLIFCPPGAARFDNTDNEELICRSGVSVDLSNATQNASGFFAESGYFFPREAAKLIAGDWHGCICDFDACLPVCPPEGNTTRGKAYFLDVSPFYIRNLSIVYENGTSSLDERFSFIMRDPVCPLWTFLRFLEPEKYEVGEFDLLENGSLFLPRHRDPKMRLIDFKHYCLQPRGNNLTYTPKVCLSHRDSTDYTMGICVSSLVAIPFVIATAMVYSVLPELRNTYGTMLRCYLCCLIGTYVTQPAQEILDHREGGHIYRFVAQVAYFWTTAGYLWLNVMSFDIWWRFSDLGSLRSSDAPADRKRFIGCSIYAWGVALVLTGIRVGFLSIPGMYDFKITSIVLFLGPVGVIVVCNICLFILTAIKMVQHNTDTRRYLNNANSKCHDENKYWFCLHVKLCVAMGLMLGITWTTRMMYWSRVWKYLYLGPTIVDALQGVLIFGIFVCKKSVFRSLKKHFKIKNRRGLIRCMSGTPKTVVPGGQENSAQSTKNSSHFDRRVTTN